MNEKDGFLVRSIKTQAFVSDEVDSFYKFDVECIEGIDSLGNDVLLFRVKDMLTGWIGQLFVDCSISEKGLKRLKEEVRKQ